MYFNNQRFILKKIVFPTRFPRGFPKKSAWLLKKNFCLKLFQIQMITLVGEYS